MSLKLVTFDLAVPDTSVQVPELLRNLGEAARLSPTTFVIETSLTTDEVLAKLMKFVGLEDDVYVLGLSSLWSGYGEVTVNQFLKGHLGGS